MRPNAITQYEKGDYNNALSNVGKYLAKNPDNEYGLYYKALIFDGMKKIKEAGWIYKVLLQKHPDFANGYYSYAVHLDNKEEYKEAIANYEKFISLSKEKNDMTDFASSRIKELKDYLGKLNAKK